MKQWKIHNVEELQIIDNYWKSNFLGPWKSVSWICGEKKLNISEKTPLKILATVFSPLLLNHSNFK